LGTAAYMSPEQAKGRPADKRSDVWAFGCVMYEMLTGVRAFQGEDVSDTLAAVLRSEPNWDALPATISLPIRALIEGCLNKDRRVRIGDMGTVRFLINQAADAGQARAAQSGVARRSWWPAAVLLGAVAAAAGGFIAWNLKPRPSAARAPL